VEVQNWSGLNVMPHPDTLVGTASPYVVKKPVFAKEGDPGS